MSLIVIRNVRFVHRGQGRGCSDVDVQLFFTKHLDFWKLWCVSSVQTFRQGGRE